MKNLFLGALMLTGVMAFAQEPAQTTPTQQPAQPVKKEVKAEEAKPAAQTQAQPAAQTQAAAADKKAEATVKEDKAVAKKADPAKKSK
jgi:hypothetical protein